MLINLVDLSAAVNFAHLSKVLIHLDDGLSLVDVVLVSSLDSSLVVVSAAASLSTLEAASNALLFRHVEVKDRLGLAADGFEMERLVEGSWESVNQVD